MVLCPSPVRGEGQATRTQLCDAGIEGRPDPAARIQGAAQFDRGRLLFDLTEPDVPLPGNHARLWGR